MLIQVKYWFPRGVGKNLKYEFEVDIFILFLNLL